MSRSILGEENMVSRRRESEGSEALGSPDPVVSELELSWASGDC
jgi:hypothetical protein